MTRKLVFIQQTVRLLLCGLLLLPLAPATAQNELPNGFTKNSDYTINYDDWNLILSGAVLDVGPSDRRPAGRNGTRGTSSKIKHGNTSKTAYEGNRVLFYEFNDEHLESLMAIRRDLEAVHDFIPLENFSRNEQLAYWFNLHNVAVMIEVTKAYPIKKIKNLVVGGENVWDNKTMMVAGVPTSIRDIEEHVVANWNSPLVLYGFFMGTVGGPNIRTEAFTGDNLVEGLQDNAIRFVNSLRGFRLWSGRGRVSDHYEMGKRYFPNFEEDIREHLLLLSRPDTRADVEKAKSFKIDNYDWGIADLKNGDTYNGSIFNTNPGALSYFIQGITTPDSGSEPTGIFAPPTSGAPINSFATNPAFSQGSSGKISPQVKALLRAMKQRNQRRARDGNVTVEEFVDGDGSRVSRKSDKDGEVE